MEIFPKDPFKTVETWNVVVREKLWKPWGGGDDVGPGIVISGDGGLDTHRR